MINEEKTINLIDFLLKNNILSKKEVKTRILAILVKSNDIKEVNNLTNKFLKGEKNILNEDEYLSILEEFSQYYDKNESTNNATEELKEQIKTQTNIIKELSGKMNKLLVENEYLKSLNKITDKKPIEVSDDDINNLYIQYKAHKITNYNEAFIIKDIIPKVYYKINTKDGDNNE